MAIGIDQLSRQIARSTGRPPAPAILHLKQESCFAGPTDVFLYHLLTRKRRRNEINTNDERIGHPAQLMMACLTVLLLPILGMRVKYLASFRRRRCRRRAAGSGRDFSDRHRNRAPGRLAIFEILHKAGERTR